MAYHMRQNSSSPRPVAVFDYDGTCIDGQSGSLLATWMLRRGYLSAKAACGLAWWGVRYKLHMPYRQEHARELIFNELSTHNAREVEAMLVEFHREVLVPRYRPRAMEEVRRRKEEGCATVLISATFETIASEAARHLGVDGFVATRMEHDASGRYTGRVLGGVIAGQAKVDAARTWADETVGPGTWQLAYAYGDHHSDIELLAAAEHPLAVCPGPTLKRVAGKYGWHIANWKTR